MISNRAELTFVSCLVVGCFLSAPVLAGSALENRVVVENASFDSAGYTVELIGAVTEDGVSKLVFKARNDGSFPIDRLEIEIEEWNEAGWLEAGASYVIWTNLGAGEERLFSEPIRTSPAATTSTYVLRRTDPEEGQNGSSKGANGLARKFAISSCANYCDRCSDKAGDRCIGGVMSVSCSCDDNSASCSYSCYPPPV